MKKTHWQLLGILLLGPTLLYAQKKKTVITNLPVLASIEDPEFTFSQGVGVGLSSDKSKKKDTLLEDANQVVNLGGRTIKIELPPREKISLLIGLPLTHYFFEIKLNSNESEVISEATVTEFYNRIYSLAKDLLTRRETPEKSFFIGIKIPPEKNEVQKLKWINTLAAAIDDARAEVKYSRCKIYSYAVLNGEPDEKKLNNSLITKLKTHYISCAAENYSAASVAETKTRLNKINTLLQPRSEMVGIRVIISDISVGRGEFADAQSLAKKLLESGATYLFLENANSLTEETKNNTLGTKLKEIYTKQNEAAREMKARTGRFPLNEEMSAYTATLL